MKRKFWLLMTLVFLSAAATQSEGLGDLKRLGIGDRDQLESSATLNRNRSPVGRSIDPFAMEAPIDPDQFYLAPGDQLLLYIGGATDTVLDLQLAADGLLIVPSLGVFNAGGELLSVVQQRLIDASSDRYGHADVSLSLLRPANRRIAITGLVAQPGIYEIFGTSRLSDLIWLAGGLQDGADTRTILVRTAHGTINNCDLLAWRTSGNSDGNPMLSSGASVHIEAARDYYQVRGLFPAHETPLTGTSSLLDRPFMSKTARIAAREGDTLDFAIQAGGGLNALSCDDGFIVIRTDTASGISSRNLVPVDQALEFELQSGDVVELPFCRDWVAVGGAVMRPGLYPYLPGESVAGYIYGAGGPSAIGRNKGWKFLTQAGSGVNAAAGDTVAAGAMIWVPERRLNKFTSVIAPLASLAALVVSIIAINR